MRSERDIYLERKKFQRELALEEHKRHEKEYKERFMPKFEDNRKNMVESPQAKQERLLPFINVQAYQES